MGTKSQQRDVVCRLESGYRRSSREASMLNSLRFTVLAAALAIAITPASTARASCSDPAGCLCDFQRSDGIGTLAVTVVAVG